MGQCRGNFTLCLTCAMTAHVNRISYLGISMDGTFKVGVVVSLPALLESFVLSSLSVCTISVAQPLCSSFPLLRTADFQRLVPEL